MACRQIGTLQSNISNSAMPPPRQNALLRVLGVQRDKAREEEVHASESLRLDPGNDFLLQLVRDGGGCNP